MIARKEFAPGWIGWAPLIVGTVLAIGFTRPLPPWECMWVLAIVLFAGFKWWTWWRVICGGISATAFRSIAYLFLWPGMDARRFLGAADGNMETPAKAWLWAATKTLGGAALIWGVARWAGNGLLAGWIGMVGMIFVLHFGIFALLALFWQRCDIPAQPLMKCPIAADSLGDFWGRRWNSGFRDIVFGLFFTRLAKRLGTTLAMLCIFVFSGLVHDLVITFPARGGYGLPTLYFTLQGVAMLFERSNMATQFGLNQGWRGRAFTLAVVAGPAYWLFPPPFVLNVMVPFLQIIKALP